MDLDFVGLFGMCEMETAAKHIVRTCLARESWDCSWTFDHWLGRGRFEQGGFLCLVNHRWLNNRPGSSAHGEFFVSREFVEHVRPRLAAAGFNNIPKIQEWYR